MNDKNNIHLEGLVIDCTIEHTQTTDKPFANIVICTTKNVQGNKEKSFYQARFAITKALEQKINNLANNCMNNKKAVNQTAAELVVNVMSLEGELRNDLKGQPFVFAESNDVRFPDKMSKRSSRVKAEGKINKILKVTPAAATILMELPGKDNSRTIIPVNIFAKSNPEVWAAVSSGEIKKDDSLSITGKADGRLYGDGKNVLFQMSVQAEKIQINKKQNIRHSQKH